jgi:hypothetical protein
MAPAVAVLIALAVGIQSGQVVAQPRPDFTGRWTIVGAPEGGPAWTPGLGGLGAAFEVRQDEKTLTLVTGNDPVYRETALPLNGDELRLQIGTPGFLANTGGPELEYVAKVAWVGTRLAVTTTGPRDPRVTKGSEPRVFTIQSWSLDTNGDLLIQTTRFVLSPTTSKATYRKFR